MPKTNRPGGTIWTLVAGVATGAAFVAGEHGSGRVAGAEARKAGFSATGPGRSGHPTARALGGAAGASNQRLSSRLQPWQQASAPPARAQPERGKDDALVQA